MPATPPKAQTPINAQAPILRPSINAVWRATARQSTEGASRGDPVNSQVPGTGGEATSSQESCVLTSVYLIAISAEAMSGALAAGRRNMDLFGVALIAFVTALGGGTVRDILLGNFPVTWTQHPAYIYLTLGSGLLTVVIARFLRQLQQLFLVLDAIGLVAFTLIGCDVALRLGYQLPVVLMAGVITGIFGGILRDILCNRTPMVLRHELYASVSLVVGALYLWLLGQQADSDTTLLAAFSVGLLLRMCAIRWKITLPVFRYSPSRWD